MLGRFVRNLTLDKVFNIKLASKEDISAMKIIAISQRGKRRDFIDIYFLIRIYGLKKVLEFTQQKYPMFNIYVGLQGLVYFRDAKQDIELKRFRLLRKIIWKEVKEHIVEEVNKVRKEL